MEYENYRFKHPTLLAVVITCSVVSSSAVINDIVSILNDARDIIHLNRLRKPNPLLLVRSTL